MYEAQKWSTAPEQSASFKSFVLTELAFLANAIASLRSVFCPDKWVLIYIETVEPLMTLISWPRFSSCRHNKL